MSNTSIRPGPSGGKGDGSGSGHEERGGSGGTHASTSIFSPSALFGWNSGSHIDRAGAGDQAGSSSSNSNTGVAHHNNQTSQGFLHPHTHVNPGQAQRNSGGNSAGASNNNNGNNSMSPYNPQRTNSNTGQGDVNVDQEASLDLLGVPDEDDDNEDDYEDEGDASGRYVAVPSQGGGNKRAKTNNSGGNGAQEGSSSGKKNKKGGGRPRDFVWVYFEDMLVDGKRTAHCKFCDYSVEQPKAFRMRQHILTCEEVPREYQALVKEKQAARETQAKEKKLTVAQREAALLDDGDGSPGFVFTAPTTSTPSTSRAPRAGTLQPDLENRPPNATGFAFDYTGLPVMSGMREASQDDDAGINLEPNTAGRKRKRNKVKDEINQSLAVLGMAQPRAGRSPITCHGRPGANIKLRMDQLGQTGFSHVASGETDTDGRNNSLLLPGTEIGKNSIFKLTFYTKDYWGGKGVESFYPFVEIVFEIKEPSEHHHIALMLSPFAYTTYRGS